mgnify:CR=1 FL=1
MGSTDAPQPEAKPTPSPSPKPSPSPTPAPTPQPTPAPTPEPTPDPLITSTIEIPAQDSDDQQGGEWNLLVSKIQSWLDSNDLAGLWSKMRVPLRLVGALILFVLISKVYNGVLNTIDSLPLAPGLLELAGLIWLLNYVRRNLLRSEDRKRVIDRLRSAWGRVIGG